ncbi:trans-Golgi network integral membrane protein 2 [Nilaparvata lugens]|uniref:trans-Golgi network integral membrane protein 2 n=1 Tax=Nilaparvata lugens TaxID=108931 RepID=UPI00193C8831|nr:trans-Golgi network integral membrane protein 2 [Nilaparvata lugens]
MVFGNHEKLFCDSATKMMLSTIIILISVSISIGLPAKPLNIAEELQNKNCSLTNKYFIEKLELNKLCKSVETDDSPSSLLCLAYKELNEDFCKIDKSSAHYRSGLYDESTTFVIHNISQFNATQVDDFLQGLNKRVKDIRSFYQLLNSFREELKPHKWASKFFDRLNSLSNSELICGLNDVQHFCSVLLWARTLKMDQTVIENNSSNFENKQQSSTETLKSPSRTAEEEMTLNESSTNRDAASAAHALNKSETSVIGHSSTTVGSPVVLPAADHTSDANTAKKPTSTVSNPGVSQNGNMEGNVAKNENVNREEVKDNRYEVVDEERQAEELKSNANKEEEEKKDDVGFSEVKVAGDLEDKEPPPAKVGVAMEGEVNQDGGGVQTSHVMSIKDRNEEEAAVSGQFDTNFNQADDKATADDPDFGGQPNEMEDTDDDGQELPVKTGSAVGVISSGSGVEQMPVIGRGGDETHFYSYFVSMGAIIVLLYLMLHYKKKLLALAVEGRRGRAHGSGRRRPNTAAYSKLDSNLEEAMASNMSQASVTHVLY